MDIIKEAEKLSKAQTIAPAAVYCNTIRALVDKLKAADEVVHYADGIVGILKEENYHGKAEALNSRIAKYKGEGDE